MKKKDRFWMHYATYIVIFLMLIVCVWGVLWLFLDSYEAGRPEYIPTKVSNLFEKGQYKKIAKYVNINTEDFNTKNALLNSLKQISIETIDFSKNLTLYTNAKPVYSITNNNKEIAVVTLKKKESKGLFGINRWEIANIEPSFELKTIKIFAPNDSKITINNKLVTADYIINTNYYSPSELKIKDFAFVTPLSEFEIKNLYPSVDIEISKGKLVPDGDNYIFQFEGNEELLNSIKGELSEFCKNYTRYVGNEVGFNSISGTILRDSPFYELMRGISNTNRWSGDHTPMEFSELEFKNMEMFSDASFKVDVIYKYSYTADIGFQENESNLTLYLINSGNKWMVVDLTTN